MGYILITGGNLSNKGAQSMMFIAVREMKKRFPDKTVVVLSDKDAIQSEQELSKYNFMFRDYTCLYGFKYKLVQQRYGRLDRNGDARNIYKNIDMIVDISGYTFGSNWGWMPNLLAAYRAKRAKNVNAPIYFMPQSFGPFEWKSISEKITAKFLKKWLSYAQVLYAREQEGYDLLVHQYGFKNVQKSVDLVLQNKGIDLNAVFKIPPQIDIPNIVKGSVAIIPNIRNTKYGNKVELIDAYKEIVYTLLDFGRTVYLLKHSAEDFELCQEIKNLFINENRVVLLAEDISCIEYDLIVEKFDYLIASRYHSIVHAYKKYVPCIVLGWATKYQELLGVLNQAEYGVNVNKGINISAVKGIINKMENNYGEESKKISIRMNDIQTNNCFDCIV